MSRAPDVLYFDYNATTPILPDVVDAMVPYLREHFGNPSSAHGYGRQACDAVARAREQVAALIGCAPEEIVFTSGGTEANNLAIRGVADAASRPGHIVTSAVEHPATAAPCAYLEQAGWAVTRVPVDATGRVEVEAVATAVRQTTVLVTIMHANNETGTLQPIDGIARAAKAHGAVVHTDAAQSVGKLPVRVSDLGVDLLSIAGHKLYAPKGVGALYVRTGTRIEPLLRGAGHERGLRPGTENVASIVGLGAACAIARRDQEDVALRLRALRDQLWALLRQRVSGLALNGHAEERLPNTLNVRFPGVSGTALLARVPRLAASTGSACHAGDEAPSPVITAMGVAPQDALGSVRLTLGRLTTEEQVRAAAGLLTDAWGALR